MSLITSLLGGVWGYVAAAVLAGGLSAFGAWDITHQMDKATLEALELSDQKAATSAQIALAGRDKSEAAISQALAVKDQQAQDAINVKTVTITKEIPGHVTTVQVTRACLSVGLMRVLRAASTQTDPDALSLAPGQSDDDCSDASPVTVAGWFTGYAGAAEANTQQLSDLQAWIAQDHAAQVAADK